MGMLHTQLFTQKQYQPHYISIRPLVKLIAVVTRTRQADKSRVNINLVLRAEVKLHFVTKDSPVNQIIFDCLLQHLFNHGIQIWENQRYYEFSVKYM